MSNTAPSRADPVVVFPLGRRCPPQETSQPHPPPYWDQLTRLKLYSLEHRRERYQIIYTWRIIEGQVPNFDCTPIQSYKNPRPGRECRVPTISPSATCAIQTIRFSSLPVKGPRLFNVLPKHLRDMSGCSTERFKGELDRYLETIPDEPLIPGLTQYRRCDSNSVIDWAKSPYLHQQNNQLQETNYPELDEVVTTWWPVGFHEHYRVSEWVLQFFMDIGYSQGYSYQLPQWFSARMWYLHCWCTGDTSLAICYGYRP